MKNSPYLWTRSIPVVGQYDVVVAGGGIAGISAALAAGRAGKRVLLLEREWALGGLATLGLITIYLPLCDGRGHQVTSGIAEELFRLAIYYGAEDAPPALWLSEATAEARAAGKRMQAQFNPWLFALSAERLLKQAGVRLLYGTQLVGAQTKNGRIAALYVENQSGCGAIEASAFIDCTGDASLCLMAEENTICFERGNILAAWYYFIDQAGYHLRILGEADVTDEDEKRGEKVTRLSDRRFSGLDGQENSDMMCFSHQALLADIEKKRRADASAVPSSMLMIPELRKTRRLQSVYDMKKDAYFMPKDAVGVIADWRRRGPTYAVPFRSLYGSKIKNLAVAGRDIGAEDEMWELTRVIPACAVTGEAAGAAAALCPDFCDVSIPLLQNTLAKNGVLLDPERSRE